MCTFPRRSSSQTTPVPCMQDIRQTTVTAAHRAWGAVPVSCPGLKAWHCTETDIKIHDFPAKRLVYCWRLVEA